MGLRGGLSGKALRSARLGPGFFCPTSLLFPITWIWDTALAALFLALIFWATLAMREAKTILAVGGLRSALGDWSLDQSIVAIALPFSGRMGRLAIAP